MSFCKQWYSSWSCREIIVLLYIVQSWPWCLLVPLTVCRWCTHFHYRSSSVLCLRYHLLLLLKLFGWSPGLFLEMSTVNSTRSKYLQYLTNKFVSVNQFTGQSRGYCLVYCISFLTPRAFSLSLYFLLFSLCLRSPSLQLPPYVWATCVSWTAWEWEEASVSESSKAAHSLSSGNPLEG